MIKEFHTLLPGETCSLRRQQDDDLRATLTVENGSAAVSVQVDMGGNSAPDIAAELRKALRMLRA
jgi:hypothetical protein